MRRDSRSFRNQNTKQKSAQCRSVEEREGGKGGCDFSLTLCCSEMPIARFKTTKHLQEVSKQSLSNEVLTVFLKGGGENSLLSFKLVVESIISEVRDPHLTPPPQHICAYNLSLPRGMSELHCIIKR